VVSPAFHELPDPFDIDDVDAGANDHFPISDCGLWISEFSPEGLSYVTQGFSPDDSAFRNLFFNERNHLSHCPV
jgi:hypothetical protein